MVKKPAPPSGPNRSGKKAAAKPPSSKPAPAPAPASRSQAGAEDPSTLTATATATATVAKPEKKVSPPELRAQQALLDIFSGAFAAATLGSETFAARLREAKQALYDRDFGAAFGREDLLEAYAARWSPTRALCYARVLRGIGGYLEGLLVGEDEEDEDEDDDDGDEGGAGGSNSSKGDDEGDEEVKAEEVSATGEEKQKQKQKQKQRTLRVFAIGGGAAETVALGAYLASPPSSSPSPSPRDPAPISGALHLLDAGPWGGIVSALHARLTTPPALSKYASAAARAAGAGAALVSPASRLRVAFTRRDVLSLDEAALSQALHGGVGGRAEKKKKKKKKPLLVTLLFTLNELYNSTAAAAGGVGPTTAFLRRLSAVACPGTLLLVVDSPGSYSEAAVGGGGGGGSSSNSSNNSTSGEKKRYPMQWLLDHTLLPQQDRGRRRRGQKKQEGAGQEPQDRQNNGGDGETPVVAWEKLESADSVWFRLADGLRYPIQLENMRYQMHLYRAFRPTD